MENKFRKELIDYIKMHDKRYTHVDLTINSTTSLVLMKNKIMLAMREQGERETQEDKNGETD